MRSWTLSSLIEQHLRELGIMPEGHRERAEGPTSDIRLVHLAKGYFNDPRDQNGEVDF